MKTLLYISPLKTAREIKNKPDYHRMTRKDYQFAMNYYEKALIHFTTKFGRNNENCKKINQMKNDLTINYLAYHPEEIYKI